MSGTSAPVRGVAHSWMSRSFTEHDWWDHRLLSIEYNPPPFIPSERPGTSAFIDQDPRARCHTCGSVQYKTPTLTYVLARSYTGVRGQDSTGRVSSAIAGSTPIAGAFPRETATLSLVRNASRGDPGGVAVCRSEERREGRGRPHITIYYKWIVPSSRA